MDNSPSWVLISGVVACGLIGSILARSLASRWRRFRARRRACRARKGEKHAEELLFTLGYRVLERQPTRVMRLLIDGRARDFVLRPDLIVTKRGRQFVAEVKTGVKAPSLETRATRRQLLEYRVACPEVEGVLLVDADADAVIEVVFPVEQPRFVGRLALLSTVLIGVLVGALGCWLALREP